LISNPTVWLNSPETQKIFLTSLLCSLSLCPIVSAISNQTSLVSYADTPLLKQRNPTWEQEVSWRLFWKILMFLLGKFSFFFYFSCFYRTSVKHTTWKLLCSICFYFSHDWWWYLSLLGFSCRPVLSLAYPL